MVGVWMEIELSRRATSLKSARSRVDVNCEATIIADDFHYSDSHHKSPGASPSWHTLVCNPIVIPTNH